MAILPIGEYPQKSLWQILLVGVQTEMCRQSDGKQKGGGVWNSPQRRKEGLPGCKGAVSGGDPGR